LGTDRLDLYLLHWRGSIPLAETGEAFAALQRRQGPPLRCQQFRCGDMEELWGVPGGPAVATNQCSTIWSPPMPSGAAALVPPASCAAHGLLADRAVRLARNAKLTEFAAATA
jgi:hypothetical protein